MPSLPTARISWPISCHRPIHRSVFHGIPPWENSRSLNEQKTLKSLSCFFLYHLLTSPAKSLSLRCPFLTTLNLCIAFPSLLNLLPPVHFTYFMPIYISWMTPTRISWMTFNYTFALFPRPGWCPMPSPPLAKHNWFLSIAFDIVCLVLGSLACL